MQPIDGPIKKKNAITQKYSQKKDLEITGIHWKQFNRHENLFALRM
jgi:hypothetical protein